MFTGPKEVGTRTIAYVVSFIGMFLLIGFLLLPILYIASIVYSIMAGMAANKGETYRYPFTPRLVN